MGNKGKREPGELREEGTKGKGKSKARRPVSSPYVLIPDP